MSNYDFKTLNDKEFEILCSDILSVITRERVERFKPGKDQGVDGRFFADKKGETILQCKHWVNTANSQLIYKLKNDEKIKVDKLKPAKYYLFVSNKLSRTDKEKISSALHPHIQYESDIFGQEDINDIIAKNPEIEKRHYKLWLHSAAVLSLTLNQAIIGRSEFSIQEMLDSSKLYVTTDNHEKALNILTNLNVLILTGEPGVGKTTLANHLCLEYLAEGFSFFKIADDIQEVENVFDPEAKQIFLFDDFLGRNYLEALTGHEGTKVTQFIRRVRNKPNKKFVLTSRSTILNQGKFLIDNFQHTNIKVNEYELKIKSLSTIDKARILYNHIWFSDLGAELVEEFYKDKKYHAVINHRNFNPRLISYITDAQRFPSITAGDYWNYVQELLDNPSTVWENPFQVQLDDFCRSIVLLVVFNQKPIKEQELYAAYSEYIISSENAHFKGRSEFFNNIQILSGSFLIRGISAKSDPTIELFNPSIADYILSNYSNKHLLILSLLKSLGTRGSINALHSMMKNSLIEVVEVKKICLSLMQYFIEESLKKIDDYYLSDLFNLAIDCGEVEVKETYLYIKAVRQILNVEAKYNYQNERLINALIWGVKNQHIKHSEALTYIKGFTEEIYETHEINAVCNLIDCISEDEPGFSESYLAFHKNIIDMLSDNVGEIIDEREIFNSLGYDGNEVELRQEFFTQVECYLMDTGLRFDADDVEEILKSYDYLGKQYDYATSYDDYGSYSQNISEESGFTEVDDLFDRS